MVVSKTRNGAWAIYSGTASEVVAALEDDGIPAGNVIGFSNDGTTIYVLIRQGV